MSIEQTDQLILLIMNSTLMTLLASGLLGGIWLRQQALLRQLAQVRSHYHQLTHQDTPLTQELKQLRAKRTRLNQQYQWSRVGTTLMHLAVLIFSLSLFLLALRSLVAANTLIAGSMTLFTLGAAGLLAGITCLLMDFASDRSNGYSLGQTFAHLIKQLTQPLAQQIKRQWPRKPLIEREHTPLK